MKKKEYVSNYLGQARIFGDGELKEILENIMKKVDSIRGTEEFTDNEIDRFLGNLRKMPLDDFNRTYKIIDDLLSNKTREDIKNNLRDYDEVSETSIFMDDRNVVVKDGKRVIEFTPHKFVLADVVFFAKSFASKLDQHSVGILSALNFEELSLEDVQRLHKRLSNREEELIESLSKDYIEWQDKFVNYPLLHDIIEGSKEYVIINAIDRLNNTLMIKDTGSREVRIYETTKSLRLNYLDYKKGNYHRSNAYADR
ncbi:MAG: hypothetical protein IJ565_00875 [Bacilli bacterium]|nr:hypothetical protein [Bacilli bacterium]